MKKRATHLGDNTMKELSKTQFETLRLLQEGSTITEISIYRKVNRSSVYKTINILLNKSFLEKIDKSYSLTSKGIKGLHSFVGLRYNLRQHNLHFKFEILEHPKNWELKRNKLVQFPYFNKRIKLKNNEQHLFNFGKIKIKTTSKSIIIKLPTIYDKNIDGAVLQAMDLLYEAIPKVERLFDIKLIKDYKANVKIISQEYARVNDSLARIYRKEADRLYITGDDGKVWMMTDFSFSVDETEYIHPIKSPDDEPTVSKMLNDLRKNPTTFSEVYSLVGKIAVQHKELLDNQKEMPMMLSGLKQQIQSHLKLIKEYREENIRWRKGKLKEIKKNINQSKILDYI